ncbi:MAG: TRAP transporter small permease subunit [Rhizobiales bacterium]|nr:TRAP transporter small permease subunit [Hyphomicrobiales bacterium]
MQQPRPTSSNLLQRLADWHDGLTKAGFALATFFVGVIAASFVYEVIARYVFDAPTFWSYAVGEYVLCATIFLSVPELTRRGAHININLISDRLAPEQARRLRLFIGLLAAGACFVAAWIAGTESWRQCVQDVTTLTSFPIPKWWVSIFIPYGFLSSAIHFLRQLGHDVRQAIPIGAGP